MAISCQAIVSSNVVQCRKDGDCAARGPSFAGMRCESELCRIPGTTSDAGVEAGPVDPKWGCLGNVPAWPKQSTSEKVGYSVRFKRLLGGTLANLHVLACASVDPNCTAPVAEVDTDANGDGVLQLPRHFRGYLHAPSPPTSFPDMAPALLAIYPPPAVDLPAPQPGAEPTLLSIAELNYLLSQVKSAADPNLGHILGLAVDCTGATTAGVSARASVKDVKTVQYYYDGNDIPTLTGQETDSTGHVGFLNIPPGLDDLDLQVPSLAKKVGTYPVLVKKGTVTLIPLGPSP